MTAPIELQKIDRRIWQEELADVVPQQVFDVHTHLYRREHNRTQEWRPELFDRLYPTVTWEDMDTADALLLPGREVHRLAFGFPFKRVDFEGLNDYVVKQARKDDHSAALLLVHPGMSADVVEEQIRREKFVGFKPFRDYSTTGDPDDCRITDFLPTHQIEVANRYGLLVMLQLSKRAGIGDPQNIADMEMLTAEYPNVRWIMAHCCRGFYPQPIERAGRRLAALANVYVDSAAVCEYASYDYLLCLIGPDRIMYGSDDLPVCVDRGKYITWGEAWAYLTESARPPAIEHCEPAMTFIRYEVLRALCRAIRRHGLSQADIDKIFRDNATNLVAAARQSTAEVT